MKHYKYPLLLIGFLFLISSCKTELYDYTYTVINMHEQETPIIVQYKILKEEAKTDTILFGESLQIAQREEVPSEKIWDIETSVSLYKIESLKISTIDTFSTSEELCYRKAWTGPIDMGGVGAYQLIANSNTLSLHRQKGYVYKLVNPLDDDLDVGTYVINDNQKRSATISGKSSEIIATVDIYTFDETVADQPKYKTQKISGLRSVTLYCGTKYKNIDMKKDTAYFKTDKDTCYIILPENIFE